VPITDQAGEAVALAIAEREVQCIIDLSDMTNAAKIRFMTPFLEHLYRKNRAALHLVVDEADEIAAQRLADGEQRMFGAFDKIVRRGRVKGFRPLMITQRPAVLHKNVMSQISTLIALQLTSPQDRKAIDDWVRGNADADQAKEVMSTLPTLARGDGWVWAPADDVLDRVTFPKITTFDSSRTPEAGEAVVAPALTAVDVEALREAMQVGHEDAGHWGTMQVQGKTAGASAADIEAAEKRGYDRGYQAGYLDARNSLTAHFANMADDLASKIRSNAGGKPEDIAVPVAVASTVPKPSAGERLIAVAKEMRASVAPSGDLSPSARKIVDAVKSSYPIGISLVVAAKRAGLSSRSSAYRKHMQDAAACLEIAERGDGRYVAVEAPDGIAPPPGTAAFKAKLPPSYAKMLDAIENCRGRAITKEDIARQAGVSPTSSGLGAGLRELMELDLIVRQGEGYALSPDFL